MEDPCFVSRRICFSLIGKEAISGWRHVRRAAWDITEGIPAAFFYVLQKPLYAVFWKKNIQVLSVR